MSLEHWDNQVIAKTVTQPVNMSAWGSAKAAAAKLGSKAKIAGQKAKLQGEMALADREVNTRKQAFGVQIWDVLEAQGFSNADPTLVGALEPSLSAARGEISVFSSKRNKIEEKMASVQVQKEERPRLAKDASFSEKMSGYGKTAQTAGTEAKLKAEMAYLDRQILSVKHKFGSELYPKLADLEDNQGWLSSDRDIRAVYDQARRDIEQIQKKKEEKEEEIRALG